MTGSADRIQQLLKENAELKAEVKRQEQSRMFVTKALAAAEEREMKLREWVKEFTVIPGNTGINPSDSECAGPRE